MKNSDSVILDMTKHGINTVVETSQEKINYYLNEYKTQPDNKFGGGVGKKQFMAYTFFCIQLEEKFFSDNLNSIGIYCQRWEDFLEDCIIYATLYSHFNNTPLPLISNQLKLSDISQVFEVSVNNRSQYTH